MPGIDDNGHSIAELARFMQDFRSEFRSTVENMVRKDVYAADKATVEAKMLAQDSETKRLDSELKTDRNERRNLRTGLLVTAAGTILTFISAIVLALVIN